MCGSPPIGSPSESGGGLTVRLDGAGDETPVHNERGGGRSVLSQSMLIK